MRFFYRIERDGSHWVAECDEMEACGRGNTAASALEQLRGVLVEHLDRPFAVAPPEDAEPIEIELVPLDEAYAVDEHVERFLGR